MQEVLVNRLGGLSLPRKSVVRLTDHSDMTIYVYCGCKTTTQQQQQLKAPNPVEYVQQLGLLSFPSYFDSQTITLQMHDSAQHSCGISRFCGSSLFGVVFHTLETKFPDQPFFMSFFSD